MTEMTEAEYIVADLILLKCPINQPFRLLGLSNNLLQGKNDLYQQDTFDEMVQVMLYRIDTVRQFFLREKYIKVIDWSTHLDQLTEEGELAQKLGGHKKYQEYLIEQARLKNIEDFPKKKWFIYEPIRIIAGFIITGFAGWLIGYHQGKNEIKKIDRTDTLKPIQSTHPKGNVIDSPRISSKKDSVLK
jgi:uncharacterized protein (UPF0297 family)